MGNHGLVIPNENGNWDILLNDSKIYEIESGVYSIITHEGNTPSVDEYMKKLRDLSSTEIKDRSREFIAMTMGGIEILAIQGKISLAESFVYGPFLVYTDGLGKKQRLILN